MKLIDVFPSFGAKKYTFIALNLIAKTV